MQNILKEIEAAPLVAFTPEQIAQVDKLFKTTLAHFPKDLDELPEGALENYLFELDNEPNEIRP